MSPSLAHQVVQGPNLNIGPAMPVHTLPITRTSHVPLCPPHKDAGTQRVALALSRLGVHYPTPPALVYIRKCRSTERPL
jgi:hypothetical protein